MSVICNAILIEISVISAWTGCTVDLAWRHLPPCWWTMFVGNRVFKIEGKKAQKTGDCMLKVQATLQVMHHKAHSLQGCIIIP